MNDKVKQLLDSVTKLAPEKREGKRRFPLMTTEGKAWLYWSLAHLTDEEESELTALVERLSTLDEKRPHWKNPDYENYWQERMSVLHRFGELEALGESRALHEPREGWTRYSAQARVELAQLEKVTPT
jgi:hypothetical protein